MRYFMQMGRFVLRAPALGRAYPTRGRVDRVWWPARKVQAWHIDPSAIYCKGVGSIGQLVIAAVADSELIRLPTIVGL